MKKLFLNLTIAVSAFYFCSCNDGENKKTDVSSVDTIHPENAWVINALDSFCSDATGVGNFVINTDDGLKMTSHFDTLYGEYPQTTTNIDAIKRKFWLDSSTIYSINEALQANFDGVRFHFTAATTPTLGYGVPYQNETGILIYPTVKSDSGHRDSFALIRKCPTCPLAPSYVEAYSGSGDMKIKAFDSIYHKNSPAPADPKNYSLSKAVWIDPCVIRFMANLITESGGRVDGISVMTAAYLGSETKLPLGAKAKQSSTIVFVPTKPSGADHVEDWTIIPDIIISLNKKGIKTTAGALNHGELCPQKCN